MPFSLDDFLTIFLEERWDRLTSDDIIRFRNFLYRYYPDSYRNYIEDIYALWIEAERESQHAPAV